MQHHPPKPNNKKTLTVAVQSMHDHVISGNGEAKFWLEPGIELAKNYHYSRKQLKEIESLIEEHYNELISAWQQHFCS